MSKPRHVWFGYVKKMIMSGYYLDNTEFAERLRCAMAEVDSITRALPNGDDRMKAIEYVLIKHTKTYDGVALELHYHPNVIKYWVAQYVNQVGEKCGM